MKRFLSCLLVIVALSASLSYAAEETRKPNIVLVITDDQGYGDLACHGNSIIKIPNLDRLHDESIRFANFHVSTTCAPSRGALMTGRHTNRLNVFHTITGRSMLWEDERLLPQILAENGHTNGMFGKWHLGDNYPYRPEDRGFHEVVRHGGGGITQGPDYWGNDYFDDTYERNGKFEKFDGYCTGVWFAEAKRFVAENQEKSFFLYLATNAPHGMSQRKFFVATAIVVFDFEFFIGARIQKLERGLCRTCWHRPRNHSSPAVISAIEDSTIQQPLSVDRDEYHRRTLFHLRCSAADCLCRRNR